MKISHDPATHVLYIQLSERSAMDSDEVSDAVVLDYAGMVPWSADAQYASQKVDIHRLNISGLQITVREGGVSLNAGAKCST